MNEKVQMGLNRIRRKIVGIWRDREGLKFVELIRFFNNIVSIGILRVIQLLKFLFKNKSFNRK